MLWFIIWFIAICIFLYSPLLGGIIILFILLGIVFRKSETSSRSNNQPAAFRSNTPTTNAANAVIDPIDKQYSLLFQIIDKNKVLEIIRIKNDAKVLYQDNKKKFEEFGKRIGKNLVDTEEIGLDEFYTFSTEDMQTHDTIKQDLQTWGILAWYADEYIKILEDINKKLLSGLSLEGAKTALNFGIQELSKENGNREGERIKYKVLGELILERIIALRQKKPNATVEELKALKVDIERMKKKFGEELEKLRGNG